MGNKTEVNYWRTRQKLADSALEARGVNVKKLRAAEREAHTALLELAKANAPTADSPRLRDLRRAQRMRHREVLQSLGGPLPPGPDPFPPPVPGFPDFDRFRALWLELRELWERQRVFPRCSFSEHTNACSGLTSALEGAPVDFAPELPSSATTSGPCVANALFVVRSEGEGLSSMAAHRSSVDYSLAPDDSGQYCLRARVAVNGIAWGIGYQGNEALVRVSLSLRVRNNAGAEIVSVGPRLEATHTVPLLPLGGDSPPTIELDGIHHIRASASLDPAQGPYTATVETLVEASTQDNSLLLLSTQGGAAGVFYEGLEWGESAWALIPGPREIFINAGGG